MKILILFSIFSWQSTLAVDLNESLLEAFCSERGGRVVNGLKCPQTFFKSPLKNCIFNEQGDYFQFVDGCTGPSGGFKEAFFSSCIAHDLCYHHEPATNGWSQKQCDKEFLTNLEVACEGVEKSKRCHRWAKTMYRALRGFGKLAYNCDNRSLL